MESSPCSSNFLLRLLAGPSSSNILSLPAKNSSSESANRSSTSYLVWTFLACSSCSSVEDRRPPAFRFLPMFLGLCQSSVDVRTISKDFHDQNCGVEPRNLGNTGLSFNAVKFAWCVWRRHSWLSQLALLPLLCIFLTRILTPLNSCLEQ